MMNVIELQASSIRTNTVTKWFPNIWFKCLSDLCQDPIMICEFFSPLSPVYMSESLPKITGVDNRCFENKNLKYEDLIHPSDREKLISAILTSDSLGYDVTYRIKRVCGDQWIKISEFGTLVTEENKLFILKRFELLDSSLEINSGLNIAMQSPYAAKNAIALKE